MMESPSSTSPPPTLDEKVIPEEKYNLVKKRLKEMTEKNECLTNDLNHAKKRLRRLAQEKTILLDRICQYDDSVHITHDGDDAMLANDSNEHSPPPSLDIDMDDPHRHRSSKKDLHVTMEDDEDDIHHINEQHLNATPTSNNNTNDVNKTHNNKPNSNSSNNSEDHINSMPPISNVKPPDSHHQNVDQIGTPHTPVPSLLRKDNSPLPILSATISKHTSPQHVPAPNHSNASTMFGSCNEYDPLSKRSSVESTTSVPSPTVSSSHTSSPSSATTSNNSNSVLTTSSLSNKSNSRSPHQQLQYQQEHPHSSSLDSAKNCTMVPSSRPKRMRRGNQEPKMRRVQPLARDPGSGEYRLPARVGILTVHSLGRVVPLTTYHNDRYIWPPGFKVSRTYLSMINSDQNTVYTCTVEENGEQGPRFRVIADDCPDQPIIANSATGVWTAIVKRANEIRNREHSNSASGPDYYGFTHATIAKMIQDLPGADQCLNYVWQKFGVMHQRTAAGVAAAAQKKLANLEIMGSANKRAPPPLGEGFALNKEDQATSVPHSQFTSTKTTVPTSSTSVLRLKKEPSTSLSPSPPPLTSPSSLAQAASLLPPPTSLSQPALSSSSPSTSVLMASVAPSTSSPPSASSPASSVATLTTSSSTSPPPPPSVSSLSSFSSSRIPHQHHRHLLHSNHPPLSASSSSILPSLATMTSTAAAAAAAVDIQQNLNQVLPPTSSAGSTPSATSPPLPAIPSTSLEHHSLQSTHLRHHHQQSQHHHQHHHHHHHHHPTSQAATTGTNNSSTVWSTLSR